MANKVKLNGTTLTVNTTPRTIPLTKPSAPKATPIKVEHRKGKERNVAEATLKTSFATKRADALKKDANATMVVGIQETFNNGKKTGEIHQEAKVSDLRNAIVGADKYTKVRAELDEAGNVYIKPVESQKDQADYKRVVQAREAINRLPAGDQDALNKAHAASKAAQKYETSVKAELEAAKAKGANTWGLERKLENAQKDTKNRLTELKQLYATKLASDKDYQATLELNKKGEKAKVAKSAQNSNQQTQNPAPVQNSQQPASAESGNQQVAQNGQQNNQQQNSTTPNKPSEEDITKFEQFRQTNAEAIKDKKITVNGQERLITDIKPEELTPEQLQSAYEDSIKGAGFWTTFVNGIGETRKWDSEKGEYTDKRSWGAMATRGGLIAGSVWLISSIWNSLFPNNNPQPQR